MPKESPLLPRNQPAPLPQRADHHDQGYGGPGPAESERSALDAKADAERMLCDRCGAQMFRMHAVWRCPACGFKTDCCGW